MGETWVDAYITYFFASIGFWLIDCIRIWFLPLPHIFIINSVRVYFTALSFLLGLTTFMAYPLYRHGSLDWVYVDNVAQCLLGLQILIWSSIGKNTKLWIGLIWFPLIMAVFYPTAVFAKPIIRDIFISVLPLFVMTSLSVNEIRGRKKHLIFGWIVSVLHLVSVFIFVSMLGKSFIRFCEVFLVVFWFDFWIQNEQEYMTCPCVNSVENIV